MSASPSDTGSTKRLRRTFQARGTSRGRSFRRFSAPCLQQLGADLGCGNGKYLPIRSTLGLTATSSKGTRKVTVYSLSESIARRTWLVWPATTSACSRAVVRRRQARPRAQDAKRWLLEMPSSHRCVQVYSTMRSALPPSTTFPPERRRASVQELIRIIAPVAADSQLILAPETRKR